MSMSMSAVGAEAAPLNAMIWASLDESKIIGSSNQNPANSSNGMAN